MQEVMPFACLCPDGCYPSPCLSSLYASQPHVVECWFLEAQPLFAATETKCQLCSLINIILILTQLRLHS